mmetsp:Transcript_13698/g.34939  ORF Transcript_13698/g.34939 Transcript_13698/m.34939 type:complete len:233 (+) Transcript_13698:864-1562(+)
MRVVQDLALALRRVADEQHVHFAPESGPLADREVLLGAAQKLQQEALLDVAHPPDRRRDGLGEGVVEVGRGRGDRANLRGGVLCGCGGRVLLALLFDVVGADLADVDEVDEAAEDAADGAYAGVNADGVCADDAGDFHAVAGLYGVDEGVPRDDGGGDGGLALRDGLGRFLDADDLLVAEFRAVVDEDEGVFGGAVGAFLGLVDLAVGHGDGDVCEADGAAVERGGDVGDNL